MDKSGSCIFQPQTCASETTRWDRGKIIVKTLFEYNNLNFQGFSSTVLSFYRFSRTFQDLKKDCQNSKTFKHSQGLYKPCTGVFQVTGNMRGSQQFVNSSQEDISILFTVFQETSKQKLIHRDNRTSSITEHDSSFAGAND